MNNKNLIPLNKRTKDEQKAIRSKGGKASVRVRRDKRTFRDTLQELLAIQDMSPDGEPLISPITGKHMSIRETIALITIKKAREGNLRALRVILDVMGERSIKVESDVKIRTDKYDHMTDAELKAEAARLTASMNNP